jgi:hypothetical protein
MEQQLAAGLGERQVAEFVEDEEVRGSDDWQSGRCWRVLFSAWRRSSRPPRRNMIG